MGSGDGWIEVWGARLASIAGSGCPSLSQGGGVGGAAETGASFGDEKNRAGFALRVLNKFYLDAWGKIMSFKALDLCFVNTAL